MSSTGITFGQARERGKGIAIRCPSCGRVGIFRAMDFDAAFRPEDVVADRRFRCRVCGRPAEASIVDINRLGREELASWTPPPGWRCRRPPTREEIMRAICTRPHDCPGTCYPCMGRANAVLLLYERSS